MIRLEFSKNKVLYFQKCKGKREKNDITSYINIYKRPANNAAGTQKEHKGTMRSKKRDQFEQEMRKSPVRSAAGKDV